MSIAHLSSGSPTWLNRGGNPVSERAAVQRQTHPSADAPGQSAKSDAPVRRNPLVAAMMAAMQSLVPASLPATTTAAPATAVAAAAAAAVAPVGAPAASPAPSSAPVDLKQRAYAFAHELYSALRGAGSDDDSGHARGGRPEKPGHHGHHGMSNSAYGDLAQRLEALAQSLDTAPASPAASPLLSAFKSLLAALAPSTVPSAPGTDLGTDPASAKLTAFLHQMAQSLGSGGSEPASSMPASGSLLKVTA